MSARTAQQHFWELRELVDLVTTSLATQDGYWVEDMPSETDATQVDGKTLAALARTSQLIHLCAIPVLWACQGGLQNLVRCLPEDSWILDEPDTNGYQEFRVTRSLLPDDWSRFDKYAFHVKELTFHTINYKLSAEFLLALRAAHVGRPLLPELRLLNWNKDDLLDGQEFSKHWDLFVGPHLEVANLWSDAEWLDAEASETMHDVLKRLQELKAPIRHLQIIVLGIPASRHAIWTAFKEFRLLTSLCLTVFEPLPYQFWKSLSELPQLSSISLMAIDSVFFVRDPAGNQSLSCSAPLRFEALGQLNLSLETQEEVVHIFMTSHFPKLRKVTLTLQLMSMRDTLQALHDHGLHATLRELRVSSHSMLSIPQDAVDSACLVVLAHFHNLTDLFIDSYTAPAFDTEAMTALASALPRLRQFELTTRLGSTVPLGALSALIARCPNLEYVALPFDASEAHVALPTHGHANRAIDVLGVGRGVVANPPEVARFLACLCPNVRRISNEGFESWQEVEALMRIGVDAGGNRETCA